jgi:hypothetical protein
VRRVALHLAADAGRRARRTAAALLRALSVGQRQAVVLHHAERDGCG